MYRDVFLSVFISKSSYYEQKCYYIFIFLYLQFLLFWCYVGGRVVE
jgi:hypothetical protein